ncbi:MAG: HAD-IA family hydrolase [Acidobacteriota bacterium]|nr:HAD-IA family hydrolase [Acidobacteriota bacterium]
MSHTQPADATPRAGQEIEVVLFDIGGVLARFAGLDVLRELTGADSELEVSARWLMSPWVRRFESGGCTDEEFAAGVVSEWQLPYSAAQFLEVFPTWLDDPFDGAEQMLRETSEHARVGCLSNTNSLQWRGRISHWSIAKYFELPFLSFELHAVKPDPAIFERVIAKLPVAPARVLFLDDVALNVEAARVAGLNSELAVGVSEGRAALRRHGVLAS